MRPALVLLYINQKLFSRPIVASLKILTFLKGQFTINKNRQAHPCTMIWFHPENIESAVKCGFGAILKFTTARVSWYYGKVLIHHIAGLSLGFMSSYCAKEAIPAFQYSGKVLFLWYHLTQRNLLQISILRILIKVRKNFCQTKKLILTSICTDCSLL